jgi:ubiquitin-like modifier-activating enzyme ATG7
MSDEVTSSGLQFQAFASAISVDFWHLLAKYKLDRQRLSEEAVSVRGTYVAAAHAASVSRVQLERDALLVSGSESEAAAAVPARHVAVDGTLKNVNTLEAFKAVDKRALFEAEAARIWADIVSHDALRAPAKLTRLLLLTFADLKKYKFYYWCAFPALQFDGVAPTASMVAPLGDKWAPPQVEQLRAAFKAAGAPAFFLWRFGGDGQLETHSDLTQWARVLGSGDGSGDDGSAGVGFVDPCALPTNPGWPLRNLLVLVARVMQRNAVTVVCFREKFVGGAHDVADSLLLRVDGLGAAVVGGAAASGAPKASGWERNKHGKLQPRMIDLADSMDPTRLAATAVDLNLKLMRWRLLPSVDLEKVRDLRCLLLGSGTLGCNVARQLLAWGVRNVTMLDNGTVSFSNPVRQSLYEFGDCVGGGKPKSAAAAAKLKQIFPDCNAVAVELSIPMAGHAIPDGHDEQVRADVAKMHQLIREHDVVYLLTDSRETRWLPTVIAAAESKLCITVALGFDTFVVMRHGINHLDGAPAEQPLGCYFCNDVVAPRDSLADRTLDQQCTVTRPGGSQMASAMAVELMVGVVHHPLGGRAPADEAQEVSTPTASDLGLLPHQVRGFLSHYQNLLLVGHYYDRCTACSARVVGAWRQDGFELVRNAMNNPLYLEELAGLKELVDEFANDDNADWAAADDEDDF